MNKKLIAPICIMAGTLALGVGSTWALFTSNAKSQVEITSGKVAVNYSASISKALSRYEDDEPYDAIAHRVEPHAATFENGSTADISVDSTGALITLDRLTPMDMVQVKVGATNDSNVNIKFRYFIKASGDLVPALDLYVDNSPLIVNGSVIEFYSAWSSVMTPNVESLFEKNIEIYFPDHGDDFDNQYQNKSASIEVGVEAVQGNARVENPVDPVPVINEEEIHSAKPSAAGKSVNIESQTGAQGYIVPFEACDENADELVLTIIPEEEPTADVPAGKDYLAYDVNIEGIKENNTAEIEARIGIGQDKKNVQVFHNGEEIDSNYVEEEGSVYFKATSFSPYDVLFDSSLETGYGFHNSYLADEGLETEHWVHEISTAEEFRNIMDDTAHPLKLGMQQYAGALDEDTVYKLLNDIDFGGYVWSTDEQIAAVNAYPFIGHLVSGNENAGVTLSNVQVTNIYNGVDTGATFCFFSRAVNATFEGINFSNCRIENPGADKAAILVGGNKTTETDYRGLELLPNDFEIKYIEFKNLNMDDTCYLLGAESLGSFCSLLRNYKDHILFENCYNEADIVGATNNVGGLLGQTSTNSSINEIVFYKCVNYGKIVGNAAVGGICGALNNVNIELVDCSNHGEIHYSSTADTVGAMGGNVNDNSVYENCVNSGDIYTKGTKTADFGTYRSCLDEDGNEVTQAKFNALYVKANTAPSISVTIDKANTKVNVAVSGEAAYYSMVISGTKEDIEVATNKAEPTRSGSIILASFNNLTLTEVQDFALLTQYGFFAPGPGECPVDEYHGSTRIGSRASTVLSTYFLDYSLHGQPGYEGGYGENSKGAYCILDNTGCTGQYYQAFLTFRPNVTYSVNAYDEDGNVLASGMAIYSPYKLGGDNNYTTEIVGYTPDVI